MTVLDPFAAIRPYFILGKAVAVLILAIAVFGLGWHFGGGSARDDLAAYKVKVAERDAAQAQADAKATIKEFEAAYLRRAEIDAQARELANSLAEQVRTAAELRSLLAEARRRGTLTKVDPKTSCPSLDVGFVRLWNAAASGRLPET
jgi:F0F1-type ATP synthase membrane subunit b/b'